MNLKPISPASALFLALALILPSARAALPPDFPTVTVTTYETNSVAGGLIFLTVTDNLSTNGTGYYSMILKNDGTPVWYQSATNPVCDLKLLPNGLLHNALFYHTLSWTGGGDVYHQILDTNNNLMELIGAANGYLPEAHDIELQPNGHALVLSYYQSYMDLSRIVSGAYPNALVAGAVVQELDAQRNAIWQWRSWDHYNFKDYYAPVLNLQPTFKNPVVDSFHLNTVTMDTDGNILISNFMMDVEKISRQTGAVMWRLGGISNQFSFVNVNPQQAVTHFSGHGLNRLANGNILIFCNADQQATRSSKVYEYSLDEANKVATLVWSYTPATPCYSWHAGNAQRLSNGNTFIGWGGASILPGIGGTTNAQVPACTEVNSSGHVVYEMKFNDPNIASYRAFRFIYPPSQAVSANQFDLGIGNTYDFPGPGVSLEVTSGGGGYNAMSVTREPYAPLSPLFNGGAPRFLPVRVKMAQVSMSSLGANIDFDVATLGLPNPANLAVYYRDTTGQGLFAPQTTEYNPFTGKLSISITLTAQLNDFGEFAFGYPDIPAVPYPPILNTVENYRGVQPYEVIAPLCAATGQVDLVNQTLPISLSWSPKGFAGWYQLQISTNSSFANPVVDIPYQTDAFYVWNNTAPNNTYYWRVNASNDGGTGDWAVGSFQTVAPFIQVKSPNSGEVWQRGFSYFIQWNDDLAENVTIYLYKAGSFASNLATNVPSTGAWKWSIPPSLIPGSDYSTKISSATNSALFDSSNLPFSIVDAPTINPGSVMRLIDGSIQMSVTAPGAATATLLGSTNFSSWQELQTVPVSNGTAILTDQNANTFHYRLYRARVP